MTAERICYALIYAAEAMIAWLYFSRLFSEKRSRAFTLGIIFIAHTVLFALSLAEDMAVNASAFLGINLLILLFCYHCNTKSALLHSAFMTFVMIGAEIIITLLLSTVVNDYTAYTYNFTVFVTLGVCSKLLYFLVIMLGTRIFSPHKGEHVDPHFLLLLCTLPLASMLVAATIVFVIMNCVLTSWLEILMAGSVLALLAANILVLMIYSRVQQLNAENTALQLSAIKDAANLEYYSMLSEQYDKQRILIHDFNKHIGILEGLAKDADTESMQSYLDDLATIPQLKSRLRICAHPILNMILVRFSEQCHHGDIDFNCAIRTERFAFIDASDVTVLFGNLLSNAFEAADCSEEKYIELSVSLNDTENNMIIALENSCDKIPLADPNGRFLTRKEDKRQHGLGIRSIERVVKKYNGITKMYFQPEENRFHCVINVPLRDI